MGFLTLSCLHGRLRIFEEEIWWTLNLKDVLEPLAIEVEPIASKEQALLL